MTTVLRVSGLGIRAAGLGIVARGKGLGDLSIADVSRASCLFFAKAGEKSLQNPNNCLID